MHEDHYRMYAKPLRKLTGSAIDGDA
jgi:hypothetical protein